MTTPTLPTCCTPILLAGATPQAAPVVSVMVCKFTRDVDGQPFVFMVHADGVKHPEDVAAQLAATLSVSLHAEGVRVGMLRGRLGGVIKLEDVNGKDQNVTSVRRLANVAIDALCTRHGDARMRSVLAGAGGRSAINLEA